MPKTSVHAGFTVPLELYLKAYHKTQTTTFVRKKHNDTQPSKSMAPCLAMEVLRCCAITDGAEAVCSMSKTLATAGQRRQVHDSECHMAA